MANYITNDGARFTARSYSDLIKQLRRATRSPTRDVKAWMKEAAARAEQQTGRKVSTRNERAFVADLMAARLIKREERGFTMGRGDAPDRRKGRD